MKMDTNAQYVMWGVPIAKLYGVITIIGLIVALLIYSHYPVVEMLLMGLLMAIFLTIGTSYIKRHLEERAQERQNKYDLDLIEEYGLKAHWYCPSIGSDNDQLYIALNRLQRAGYIFFDNEGCLQGAISTARSSSDEIAHARRSGFKVIPNSDESK